LAIEVISPAQSVLVGDRSYDINLYLIGHTMHLLHAGGILSIKELKNHALIKMNSNTPAIW
jgi:hypothetical protein